MKKLAKYSEQAYAALRIAAGFMFSMHGAQKILGVFAEQQPAVFTQMWFGGLIELVGGVLILIGFQTRWAAFIASGTMAVAYIQFHWKFQFDANFFPLVNRGELAVLYAFVFLLIAARGAGMWSVDGPKK